VSTTNKSFVVKNGLAVGGATGIVDVINSDGVWIGATGTLHGATGLTGATGIQGASGTQGINGASGYVGSNGSTGATGVQGDQGSSGATGVHGASGSTGAQGPSGQSTSFYKYQAKTNSQTNDPGSGYLLWNNSTLLSATNIHISHLTDDNIDIDIFLALINLNDVLIIQDRNNSANYQKWQVNGTPTVHVNSYVEFPVALLDSGGSAITGNQAIFLAIVSTPVDGATGVQGASGATGFGEQGIQGASGATGSAGTNGTNGATGLSGSNGTNGATGTAGVNGATGSAGVNGATGTAGIDGATGTAGTNGTNGATGSSGTNGATGIPGSNGTNGATGVAGSNGTNGATGSAGSNGTNGATGVAGSNGTNGATGSAGTNGIDGSTGATGIIGSLTNLGATGINYYPVLAGSTGPLSAAYLGGTNVSYNPSTTLFSGPFINATADVTGSRSSGAISYGTLNYSDVNILASFASSANTYNQMLLQNGSNGIYASTNFVVSNDLATNSTYYGEFGMNSSGFVGGNTSAFDVPNAVYLASQSSSLAIGTYGLFPIRFVVNNGANDAMTIAANAVVYIVSSLYAGNIYDNGTRVISISNAAFNQANNSFNQANNAFNIANVAYSAANTKFNSSGGTISGDVTINGNFFVNGTTTTVNTAQLLVEDNIVTLNSTVPINVPAPSINSGIEINRGLYQNTQLVWSEQTFGWRMSDGNTFASIASANTVNTKLANTGTVITTNGSSVFAFSNTTDSTANSTGSVQIAGGVSVTGNVSVGSSVLLINNSTNLPGARIVYNSTANSIDFIFS
jgi:hypothetical protein